MPRKTKEPEENKINTKKTSTKNVATNTAKSTAKSTTSKKTASKETKKASTTKASAKKTTAKTSSAKSTSSKKAAKSTVAKKTNVTKKSTTKKSTTGKKTTTKKPVVVEYYDLPYRYNQTVVKVLAQTPTTLFIYWDISDDDRKKYVEEYGENFFETTKPVLIIHNDTLNYSFEVEINDFANSWYLHVNDSKSDYRIELGRRPIHNNEEIKEDYIYLSSSNEIESPNDHILFNNTQKMVYYRNVKTNQEIQKPISSISFIKNMGKIYDIYDLYQELYKNEDNLETLSNPSSNTSSQFK